MASTDPMRPNVIVILTDDQGTWAVGRSGGDAVTPHLDRMAHEGLVCENFFSTSPVCSPARASLLTGAIPSQHGVHDWIVEPPVGTPGFDYLRGMETYVDVLSRNGYTCGLVGKWHLGQQTTARNGFSSWSALPGGASPYFGAPLFRDGQIEHPDGYLTDVLTDRAIDFIGEQAASESPFYLSLHYTAPHAPWIDSHPPELEDIYRDCDFTSIPRTSRHPWARQFHDVMRHAEQHPRANLIGYFAAVSGLDHGVGRILESLTETGIGESTLVVFLSDNGFNAGHHGIWGKGNGTFPMNLYDTSVRVPCQWWHPGRIAAGRTDLGLRSGYDFRATILDYLGLADPYRGVGPGASFAPALIGNGQDGDEFVVVHAEYGPARMIRTRDWKLVMREPYGPGELYDLGEDPDEEFNRIDDPGCVTTRRELADALHDWFTRHGDGRRDGRRFPVTGAGQRTPVHPVEAGERVFEAHPEVRFPWEQGYET